MNRMIEFHRISGLSSLLPARLLRLVQETWQI